ncbi:unnamed protein product [Moneuplotes crassus]|uniref:TLC domain-containing protein n=1 Tax=Euplotes crassus TaxID=5936 RepID=A0AAD1UMU3_EUPCR|nr:unnamed protein product [Moneuplotes crassus]
MKEKKEEKEKSHIEKIIEVSTPSQIFCLALTLILLGYTPKLIHSCYSYTRFRRLEKPEYTHESFEDFWIVIPCSIVLRLLKMFINTYTYEFFKRKLNHKYSGDELDRKIKKCTRGIFKVLYFSFTFYLGLFKVLKMTNFAPSVMFGNGELLYTVGDWPYTPMPSTLKFYYLLSFSYYVEDGIVHLFLPPNYDYWEMVLHHVITCMLIFSSYMSGFWCIGIFVLIQMDFEDIWIGLIRVIMDFSSVATLSLLYLLLMAGWGWFRFYTFSYCVFYSFAMGIRVAVDNYSHVVSVMAMLLATLLGLNIYWFALLLKMGITLIRGKPKDLQMVVTKKEMDEQN